MRGSDFQNLPISFLVSWPLLLLAIIGMATVGGIICFGFWWIVSHLQWV